MVTLPFSPFACAVVTTTMLVLTFYAGCWCGIKWMTRIYEEMEKYECEE